MSGTSLPVAWRNAVRDGELSWRATLVALILSTYLNGQGSAFPSRRLLAQGAKLGRGLRSVDKALRELEVAGYLEIERSRGRSSHRYQVTIPSTAHLVRRSEFATAQDAALNRASRASNRARRAPESAESAESGALDAVAADCGAARALNEDECGRCRRRPLVDEMHCVHCLAELVDGEGERMRLQPTQVSPAEPALSLVECSREESLAVTRAGLEQLFHVGDAGRADQIRRVQRVWESDEPLPVRPNGTLPPLP